ncbi:MAG: adenosylmethionine decarboxylase [Patescibacteria group bacterium]|nr:adenosylmethionine decarboxylase [Patescibacteria group bacterium]
MKKQNADHYIFEVIFNKIPGEIEEIEYWIDTGRKALKAGDFEILAEKFHKFEPHGLSGVWLLGESHLSVHSWPEEKIVFIDLFSCGDHIQAENAYKHLLQLLTKIGGKAQNVKKLTRGFCFEKENGE